MRLPSGRVISADVFTYTLRPLSPIHGYRVTQKALDHFALELTSARELPRDLLETVESRLRAVLAEPVRLEIRHVAEIGRRGDKRRAFNSELAP